MQLEICFAMRKKRPCLLQMESLPYNVVEHILERVPAKSLGRSKVVSKHWKSIIESPFFQQRQFKHRQQSGGEGPDILMVSVRSFEDGPETWGTKSLRTLVLGSRSPVKIPTPWENTHHFVCQNSCDGLVCLYYPQRSGFVVNPTTRWHRVLPLSNYQQLIIGLGEDMMPSGFSFFELYLFEFEFHSLGFGKDKFTGTFKPVWLYNSQEFGLENATTCEVFDFSTNSWRYVTHPAPYPVTHHDPAYVDGSLYWLTDGREPKVLSMDLHTETFQVISKAPFADLHYTQMFIGNLDNRLCVSTNTNFRIQDIWLFNAENKTWDKMYSIDLFQSHKKFRMHVVFTHKPLALLLDGKKKKKNKLLYCARHRIRTLAIYDLETQSCDAVITDDSIGYPVSYFPSLISI